MRWLAAAAVFFAMTAAAEETRLYVMDVPPYAQVGGDRHGIAGDVALEAMKRAGLTPKVVEVPNARALHDVPLLENALIVPVARLGEREQSFTWIARILTVDRSFFTLGKKVRSFAEARKQFARIGAERGSAAYSILLHHGFPENRLINIPLDSMGAKMLKAGRIDAWFGLVREGQSHDLVESPIAEASTEQYLACSKGCNAQMVKRLGDAVRAMEAEGTIRKIAEGYGGAR